MAFDQLRLFRPLYLLYLSASFIPGTVLHLLTSLQFSKFLSWSAFQHAWFSRFWSYFGPMSADFAAESVEPLMKDAEGVVLDIGPGAGQWLYLLAATKNEKITKVYGVEPNREHHSALRQAISQAGLEDTYEILGVGVEDLEHCGIEKSSVDTIMTIQVLCSVPRPQTIVRELYPYLKPGGRWLVSEHIRTHRLHDFVGVWQRWLDLIWPQFFDGCSITRPTDEWLLQAGEWESVNLKPGIDETVFDTLPRTIGVLVKKA